MFIQKCLVSPTCKNTPSGGRRIAATIRQKSTNNLLTELQGWIYYRFSLPYALLSPLCEFRWVEVASGSLQVAPALFMHSEFPRRTHAGNSLSENTLLLGSS